MASASLVTHTSVPVQRGASHAPAREIGQVCRSAQGMQVTLCMTESITTYDAYRTLKSAKNRADPVND